MSKQSNLLMTPYAMEPMFPEDVSGSLDALAINLIERVAALQSAGNPITRAALADFTKTADAYYLSLLLDIPLHPNTVKMLLEGTYSSDKNVKANQLELAAHLQATAQITTLLTDPEQQDIPVSSSFLSNVHKQLYTFLQNNGLSIEINPGDYRTKDVNHGKTMAPYFGSLPFFMSEFENVYDPQAKSNKSKIKRIIGMAASHQRLAWIYPFEETHPHLIHLLNHAQLLQEGLLGNGLWSISRGFARTHAGYQEKIATAALPRLNGNDGRGQMSNKHLYDFCAYFLHTAIEQVKFMSRIFDTEKMLKRIENFADLMVSRGKMRTESKFILIDVFLKGKISKPDAMRITETSDKTLKLIVDDLIDMQLLKAQKEGIHMMYYACYPLAVAPLLFPGVYPADIEIELMETMA